MVYNVLMHRIVFQAEFCSNHTVNVASTTGTQELIIHNVIQEKISLLAQFFLLLHYISIRINQVLNAINTLSIFQEQPFIATYNGGKFADFDLYAKKTVDLLMTTSAVVQNHGWKLPSIKLDPFDKGVCFGGCLYFAKKIITDNASVADLKDNFSNGVAYSGVYYQAISSALNNNSKETLSIKELKTLQLFVCNYNQIPNKERFIKSAMRADPLLAIYFKELSSLIDNDNNPQLKPSTNLNDEEKINLDYLKSHLTKTNGQYQLDIEGDCDELVIKYNNLMGEVAGLTSETTLYTNPNDFLKETKTISDGSYIICLPVLVHNSKAPPHHAINFIKKGNDYYFLDLNHGFTKSTNVDIITKIMRRTMETYMGKIPQEQNDNQPSQKSSPLKFVGKKLSNLIHPEFDPSNNKHKIAVLKLTPLPSTI